MFCNYLVHRGLTNRIHLQWLTWSGESPSRSSAGCEYATRVGERRGVGLTREKQAPARGQ